MWVIFLEAALALGLLLALVWFTWPKKRKERPQDDEQRNE